MVELAGATSPVATVEKSRKSVRLTAARGAKLGPFPETHQA
jgi:hypothetical protein